MMYQSTSIVLALHIRMARHTSDTTTLQGVEAEELKKMVQSSQPKTNATTPDAVKFHDDKSLYTGTKPPSTCLLVPASCCFTIGKTCSNGHRCCPHAGLPSAAPPAILWLICMRLLQACMLAVGPPTWTRTALGLRLCLGSVIAAQPMFAE
jgi:p25-alpha